MSKADVKISCEKCVLTFPCWGLFKSHDEIHLKKRYQCTYCSLKLRSKDDLIRHLCHTCTGCLQIFCNLNSLEKHLSYKCADCTAMFCKKYAFRKHLVTHNVKSISRKIIQAEDGPHKDTQINNNSGQDFQNKSISQYDVSVITGSMNVSSLECNFSLQENNVLENSNIHSAMEPSAILESSSLIYKCTSYLWHSSSNTG